MPPGTSAGLAWKIAGSAHAVREAACCLLQSPSQRLSAVLNTPVLGLSPDRSTWPYMIWKFDWYAGMAALSISLFGRLYAICEYAPP